MAVGSLGEANSSARLTEKKVLAIRTLHGVAGMSITELSQRLDIPRTTIRDVINRKTWTHL